MTLPVDLLRQEPMLARASKSIAATPDDAVAMLDADPNFVFNLKYDGVRALAYVVDGRVTLRNRQGNSLTERFTDVVHGLKALSASGTFVLDGEIVCYSGGKPNFHRIQRRNSTNRPSLAMLNTVPATFVAFDLLWLGTSDLRRSPLWRRRKLLDSAWKSWDDVNAGAELAPQYTDGATMWAFVTEHRLEGLVAKDRRSYYYGRRDPAWIKVKATRQATVVVTGVLAGEGSRTATFGALTIAMVDPDSVKIIPVGRVGSGFTNDDLDEIVVSLSRGDRPLLINVEYQEISPNGSLRFPVFKKIADNNIDLLAASVTQLTREEEPPHV